MLEFAFLCPPCCFLLLWFSAVVFLFLVAPACRVSDDPESVGVAQPVQDFASVGVVDFHIINFDDDVAPFRFMGEDAVVLHFFVPGHDVRRDVRYRVPVLPFLVDVCDLDVGFVVGELSLNAAELECAFFLVNGSHRSYPVGEGEL